MRIFENFACVDWSGAKGERPPGIAVAVAPANGPPKLLSPKPRWSRADVGDWLLQLAETGQNILIGFDLSMGLPFLDEGAYFPEWESSPADAKSLWTEIDRISDKDPHLTVNSFLETAEVSRHFRHGQGRTGDLFSGGIGRLRVVEHHQRATAQANSASCFNLVGAAQVGKSSLTGMRMLNRLQGQIPVWPFDSVPDVGPVIVEIYTTIAALAAGLPKGRSKIRDRDSLENALLHLDCPLPGELRSYDDHSCDAVLTAAWMRRAATNAAFWNPEPLTDEIAEKEGWTFGVV